MPLVTLTVRRGKDAAFKSAVLEGVHCALVASGVPEADRFHRVLELSAGRSVKVKRKIAADLIAALRESPGLDPENVMLAFKETTWENWSFGGGRFIHV